jgi:hypothetical protein
VEPSLYPSGVEPPPAARQDAAGIWEGRSTLTLPLPKRVAGTGASGDLTGFVNGFVPSGFAATRSGLQASGCKKRRY